MRSGQLCQREMGGDGVDGHNRSENGVEVVGESGDQTRGGDSHLGEGATQRDRGDPLTWGEVCDLGSGVADGSHEFESGDESGSRGHPPERPQGVDHADPGELDVDGDFVRAGLGNRDIGGHEAGAGVGDGQGFH